MATATVPNLEGKFTRSATVTFLLDDLREAFTAVARATPSRTTRPILQNVRLDLSSGYATLTGTNLEIWLQRRLVVEHQVLSVLLPSKTVGDILRHADDDTIELHADGNRLKLKTSSSSWQLTTEDVDLFPTPPEVSTMDHLEVASDRLRLAIQRVIREARQGEEKGQVLSAVQVEPLMLGLTLTTLNGRSMAHQKVEAAAHGTPYSIAPLPLVPDAALRLLAAVLERNESPVRMSFPKNWARFETDDVLLIARQAEGRFIDWRPHVGSLAKSTGTIAVPAGSLRRAIARAAVALDETTKGLNIELDKDGLDVLSESSRGESRAHLDVEWKADFTQVRIDPQYILPMLSSLGDEMPVSLSAWNDLMPLRLTTEDGFLGFVQPMDLSKKG